MGRGKGYNSCLFAAGDNRSARPQPLRGSDIIPSKYQPALPLAGQVTEMGISASPRPSSPDAYFVAAALCSSSTHAQCERPPAPAAAPTGLEFARSALGRTVSSAPRRKASEVTTAVHRRWAGRGGGTVPELWGRRGGSRPAPKELHAKQGRRRDTLADSFPPRLGAFGESLLGSRGWARGGARRGGEN